MDSPFGSPNSKAPPELACFAFLIGKWRCMANVLWEHGQWQILPATWIARYVLDGYAIMDEYRMSNLTGDPIVLGANIRTFEAARQRWQIRWLNALSGEWTDLCSEELGGVRFEGNSVSYAFREPAAEHIFTRTTYTLLSRDHFTWRGGQSSDAATWNEFMLVDCHRIESASPEL